MAEHPNATRCHHVRTNGLRCGSPAMRNNKHCYYHRKTLGSPRNRRRAELTNLEDGNAIQLAIAHLDRQIDMGTIEYRAAHIKADLYRLALRNLKNMNPDPCNHKDVVTFDPTLEDDDTSTAEPITPEPITHDQELELMEENTASGAETRNDKPNRKRETGNYQRPFEDLSDKEQEEMIMRLSKNDAYFLPEDTSKQPPESADDFGELVAILRKELAR